MCHNSVLYSIYQSPRRDIGCTCLACTIWPWHALQRFLQFRLAVHGLSIAAGRFTGPAHVDRAHRVCLACNSGAVVDEEHLML